MRPVRILIGCEESQEICKAFRALGPEFEAYSCDLKPCSGGHPEWHIQADVQEVALHPHRYFPGSHVYITGRSVWKWDAIIIHPECTHLAVSGARHFAEKRKDGRQRRAIEFFLKMWDVPARFICIENPVGIMSGDRAYLEEHFPDLYEKAKNLPVPQFIQPYEYGHPETKKTCLWLKGLPKLVATNDVYDEMMALPKSKRNRVHYMSPGPKRAEMRSKTYPGWAAAMAEQWGKFLKEQIG